MTNMFKIGGLAAALAVVVAAQAVGQTRIGGQSIQIDPSILQLKPIVTCSVSGTPSEFPDDLWFFNKGVGALAKGTKVQWSLPGTTKKGQFVLSAALPAGQAVFAPGILGNGYEAGHACKASA